MPGGGQSVEGVLSIYRYIVVRRQEGGRWSAGLGWGDLYEDLIGSWPTERMAERAACEAWRRRVKADGIARAPEMPLVLRLEPGQNASVAAQSGRDVRAASPTIWLERLMVGTGKYERAAMERLRAGRATRGNLAMIEDLLERAADEGAPLHDAAELAELIRKARSGGVGK